MSTVIEERLRAALHARADLVQPEDLRHLALPAATRTPVWRRPAVVALVAAAAVAAIAVPLALKGDNTGHPLPAGHFPMPTSTPAHTLSGDVDGDGQSDRIRVSGHRLIVTLAADPAHPLSEADPYLAGLAGLADVGTPGLGILTAESDADPGQLNWQLIAVRHGTLHVVSATGLLGVYPGHLISWITPTGVPMSGFLDSMQRNQRRLAVRVTRFAPGHGRLKASFLGNWCWDVVTQKVPAPCPAGVTDAFDPGPHGSLPKLLPRFDTTNRTTLFDGWETDSVSLHLEEGPVHARSELKQAYDLIGTIDGHDVSAPAGVFQPGLVKTFVDLGHGVRGLVVINDAPSAWKLLSFVDDKLVPLQVSQKLGTLFPGTTATLDRSGDGHPVDTWVGPDGQVFSTVQTGGIGQDELYQWQVTDGSGTTLEAVDLGAACIDDYWGTYGTCGS